MHKQVSNASKGSLSKRHINFTLFHLFTLKSPKVWITNIPRLDVSKLELRNYKGYFFATRWELREKIIFWTANLPFHGYRRQRRFLHYFWCILVGNCRLFLQRGCYITQKEANAFMIFCILIGSQTNTFSQHIDWDIEQLIYQFWEGLQWF